MTDKELLELAAKAAGIELIECPNGIFIQSDNKTNFACTIQNEYNGGFPEQFNPLKFDHQALRLAVKLNMHVDPYEFDDGECGCDVFIHPTDDMVHVIEKGDKYASTRRAIVRAAAEIGKTL